MIMESNNPVRQIDFVKISKAAMKRKRLYIYSLPAAFAIACFIILSVPRYYTCTVKLAPEMSSLNASSLNDITSSFGFDIGGASGSNDAIFPEMYPELMESVTFRTGLFPIDVHTADGEISTTYYDIANLVECVAMFNSIKGLSVFRIVTKPCADRFLLLEA